MLDANLKSQLSAYLERIVMPIELVAALDDSESSRELEALLIEIAALSGNISLAREADERTPSFLIRRVGAPDVAVRFAGIPLGHEFTSLVLALLQVGGHPPKVDAALIEQAKSLRGEYQFESYYSLSCQNCPDVVQALNLLAVLNPGVRHVAIDGALYRDEVEARDVMAVPAVFLNGRLFAAGRMDLPELLGKLDGDAPTRLATSLAQRAPYDVLIVGGGPAGAAAAIYAARKGIRTGIAGERFGGQLLDTLGIENLVAVEQTEGPALAASLERNVRDYGVEVINQVRAEALLPAVDGGHHQLRLSNGATLLARTLILATGARWRSLDVPGEEQYRNRGVAYCPHCDGPLFKGKRVAVVGGGNSGVEAAIDLAGIVEHVTLLEFAAELRADDVLQQKLASLSNVQVILNAQTTEITGDGQRVNGLVYRDRRDGQSRSITLAGVFVQIGLLPNTEWLRGSLELSKYGEILIDERGVTSVPGVFAAGDATTVPYKQIVVAMGAGSTAALSAFEHLIRHSAPVEPEAKAA